MKLSLNIFEPIVSIWETFDIPIKNIFKSAGVIIILLVVLIIIDEDTISYPIILGCVIFSFCINVFYFYKLLQFVIAQEHFKKL